MANTLLTSTASDVRARPRLLCAGPPLPSPQSLAAHHLVPFPPEPSGPTWSTFLLCYPLSSQPLPWFCDLSSSPDTGSAESPILGFHGPHSLSLGAGPGSRKLMIWARFSVQNRIPLTNAVLVVIPLLKTPAAPHGHTGLGSLPFLLPGPPLN